MYITFYILSVICLVATIISSLRAPLWYIKVWDVSRVHITIFMTTLIMVGLFILPWSTPLSIGSLALLFIGVVYHYTLLYPFTLFHKVELQDTSKRDLALKIITINVRQKNKDYQRLIQLIEQKNPDVFLLTEVDLDWIDAITSLKIKYEYTVLHPQENTYGIALYSKYELLKSEIKFLVEKNIPSIHTIIKFKGNDIQFLGLHPRPPAPWTKPENKDIELIKVAGLTNHDRLPTIVGGDLNDVGWSRITRTFKYISGLLDPRIGRGFYTTYNALIPVFRVPVDHFFVSKHFKLVAIKKLEKIGSDHFPVLLEVNLETT